ncbi:carboxypeptidase regulatory-like domain-containing protein [Candidatus Palauibacter sp.]|uniref:carboxypeptidase regulatory-like domain-containing protein n=1 Tax=Candidatus Palauibacter sp. TaxID=3101350 RepID=UPI003CC6A71B
MQLCEPGQGAGEVTLEGTVEDGLTEVTLPTARVRASYSVAGVASIQELEVRADSLGRYRVCHVPAGADVTLAASYGLHVGASVAIEALSGVQTKLTVPITVPGSITGRVLNEATGNAFRTPVSVIVVGTDFRTVSNSSGRFSFESLPPGYYEIRGVCSGFNSLSATVEVTAARQTHAMLVLRPVDRAYRRGCDN